MRWLESFIFATFLAGHAFAAGSEPQVVYFEQKVSVDAQSIPLSRLLQLWDEATGMHSSVPRELANQTVTVKFSELPLGEAVRRIFEKLPMDYIFTEAQGIIVTGRSQAPPPTPPPIPTPFGPIPNRGENPFIQLPPVPGAPPPPRFFAPAAPFAPLPDSGENPVLDLPPVLGAPPAPKFFAPEPAPPPVPPVNTQDDLFRPLSIYRDPSGPPPGPPSPPGPPPK
jgi:hypothetical protein